MTKTLEDFSPTSGPRVVVKKALANGWQVDVRVGASGEVVDICGRRGDQKFWLIYVETTTNVKGVPGKKMTDDLCWWWTRERVLVDKAYKVEHVWEKRPKTQGEWGVHVAVRDPDNDQEITIISDKPEPKRVGVMVLRKLIEEPPPVDADTTKP